MHGSHRSVFTNGPSSHSPSRASWIDLPVTTSQIANPTSPRASIAGITSGRFTTRVAISRMAPKARAGTHRSSSKGSTNWLDRAPLRLHARGDPDAALHQQPAGAGEEAADDRVRDEPREIAESEHAEQQERRRRQERHDEGGRDDGEEGPMRCSRTRPARRSRPRSPAPRPRRPARCRRRLGGPPSRRGPRASPRPRSGRCRSRPAGTPRGTRRTRARRTRSRGQPRRRRSPRRPRSSRARPRYREPRTPGPPSATDGAGLRAP